MEVSIQMLWSDQLEELQKREKTITLQEDLVIQLINTITKKLVTIPEKVLKRDKDPSPKFCKLEINIILGLVGFEDI